MVRAAPRHVPAVPLTIMLFQPVSRWKFPKIPRHLKLEADRLKMANLPHSFLPIVTTTTSIATATTILHPVIPIQVLPNIPAIVPLSVPLVVLIAARLQRRSGGVMMQETTFATRVVSRYAFPSLLLISQAFAEPTPFHPFTLTSVCLGGV